MKDAVEVTMSDGRKVSFGKSQKVKKEIVVGKGVRFDARNGDTYLVDITKWPDETQTYSTYHGASQKLGDEYADTDSPEDCMEIIRELDLRLQSAGGWKAERQGFSGQSVLLRACVMAFGKTPDETRVILKDLTTKEKAKLKLTAEVAPHIKAIDAEQAKGVDISSVVKKFV